MGIKTVEDGVIIPAIYDFVAVNSDGLFNVTQGEEHAYFDLNGNVVIPFQKVYESYGNFTEGLARVYIDSKWGFINKKGVEAIKPQFHFAEEFSEGRAIVRNDEGEHGAIDKKGNLVIDYGYHTLTRFENGYAHFGDLKTWGLIDNQGKQVVPQKYIHIGKVENEKVTVQIREDEVFREGVLKIGGEVEWNSNLDALNDFNLKQQHLIVDFEDLINEMYLSGCPCEYQRFRHFIQWDKPVSFLDQERLFSVFSGHLTKVNDNVFKCTCGTIYSESWEQYNAFLWVLNVKIHTIGNYNEKGLPIKSKIPVSLGFQGYDLEKLRKTYVQGDNATLIRYLKERE